MGIKSFINTIASIINAEHLLFLNNHSGYDNMKCCSKCMTVCGLLMLALGVCFLLVDLNVWSFWGVNWWTAAFLLFGLGKFGASRCPDCK